MRGNTQELHARKVARVAMSMLAALVLIGCASGNRPLALVAGSGPVYPAEAKAREIEGHVVVRYDVASDGRVVNARVDEAEPPGVFDDAALSAVRSWRYQPRTVGGEAETVYNVLSTVRFRLDDGDRYVDY